MNLHEEIITLPKVKGRIKVEIVLAYGSLCWIAYRENAWDGWDRIPAMSRAECRAFPKSVGYAANRILEQYKADKLKDSITGGPLSTTHTKGPMMQDKYGNIYDAEGRELLVCGVALPCGNHPRAGEARANAAFIAEAFTVAHETGKTPRQLAEEHREMLEALKSARVWMIGEPENSDDDNEHTRVVELVHAAIAKAEGED